MVLVCFFSFWLTGCFLARNYDFSPKLYSTLDGLRGYLGYAVFLSHCLIWKEYVASGIWDSRDQFTFNLGSASVYLFFCISSFLFVGKIYNKKIDWKRLYVGRVLRLVPLWFSLFLTAIILLWIDYGTKLRGTAGYAIKSIDISYSIVTSGVTWSLWYEWLLYFSLPLLSMLLFRRFQWFYVSTSILIVLVLSAVWKYDVRLLSYFFIGGLCFFIQRNKFLQKLSNKSCVRSIVLCSALVGYYLYGYQSEIFSLAFLLVAFSMIALGGDILGILGNKVSHYLSEMGYSLYLLQGPFIYLVWKIFGFEFVNNLDEYQYIGLIFSVTPIYVLICRWTYKYIEQKFNNEKCISYILSKIRSGGPDEYRS